MLDLFLKGLILFEDKLISFMEKNQLRISRGIFPF